MVERELLFRLAEDAFDVLNWARREGMKRDRQLNEVVEAFRKTLADTKTTIHSGKLTEGGSDGVGSRRIGAADVNLK
jgi:hypothetical protein